MKTVLVVDDEPHIITYLTTLLRDNGYQTAQARSAEEAKERVTDEKPDLISLDIMMPKQSGIAFYRDLKLDEQTKDIPVIFVSAFSLARDFTGPGFRKLIPDEQVPEPEAYLEKPVEVPRLLEVIRSIVG